MQNLIAPPRDHLTYEYVRRLLTGDAPHVRPGLRLLDRSDRLIEDITDDLVSGNVSYNNYATIPGTCSLTLSRELVWGVHRIQPYVELSDLTVGDQSALFYLGVYIPVTPSFTYATVPRQYEITAYDKIYNLDRLIGDTWTAPQGARYLDEVVRALNAAGETSILLDSSAQTLTLPKARVWPLIAPDNQGGASGGQGADNATWLTVINDLLSAIGYRSIWVDEMGRFRSAPFVASVDRAPEFEFNADTDDRIVGEEVTVVTDRWQAPNAWKFIWQNMPEGSTPIPGNGIFEHLNQSDGPTSIDAVGQRNYRVEFLDAESHAALETSGMRIVDSDRRVETVIETNTGPFPALGAWDVFTYSDARHGGPVKVAARTWTVDLGPADTTHQWEEVTT